MHDIDKTFDGIYDNKLIEAKHALSTATYEDRIVKRVMTRVGLAGEIKGLVNIARERTNKFKLTFTLFHEIYPGFPVLLRACRIPFMFQTSAKDLFNNFNKLVPVKRWLEMREEAPPDRLCGLIFDWPGFKGTQMIIHDEIPDAKLGEVLLSTVIGNEDDKTVVYLERLEPFLDDMAKVYTPY